MADVPRDNHNSSPMPGVVRNTDPALDISKEHHHEHLHHGANAEKGHVHDHDHVAYTTGTTNEPSVIPKADPLDDALHRRGHPERKAADHDIEKTGGLEYDEKGSLSKEQTSTNAEAELEDPKRHRISRFYRAYRLWVHVVIGAFFTG
jgi:CNT family concentrative nucleoside transporter